MPRRPLLAALATSGLVLAAAWSTTGGEPADPLDPPPPREDGAYIVNEEAAIFDGPPAEVRQVLRTEEGGVLAFVEPTPRIPGIAGLTPLVGAFPDEGAVRRVELADGNSATERVLVNDEARFAYQVWGLTSTSRVAVDHVRAEFRYEPTADGRTEVTWTYAVAPRPAVLRPFVRDFVEGDIRPFMESGLEGAAAAFNSR